MKQTITHSTRRGADGSGPKGVLLTLVAATALFLSEKVKSDDRHEPTSRIVPIQARFGGQSYGEWIAQSYQWSLSLSAAGNPIFPGNESNIAAGQSGPVWFLAELLIAPVIDLHYKVPAGTALYIPLDAAIEDNVLSPCPNSPTNYTLTELRQRVHADVQAVTDLQVEIDGVPVKDVEQFHAASPPFFIRLPDENVFQMFGCPDVSAGVYGPVVAEGFALLLEPLSVGEHTVHETACATFFLPLPCPNLDITWHITVLPRREK